MIQDFNCGHLRSVAVQSLIEARKLSRYTGIKLGADVRVRVQQPLQICLECRSKSKKCDKQLTFIVRVMVSSYFLRIL
jgi:hypothetical protein